MKSLFLSNFFPPYGQGGYEEWCREIAVGLRERGHEVIVLTSRHRLEERQTAEPGWIRRELHLEMPLVSLQNGLLFFTRRRRNEEANLAALRALIQRESPDRALVWGMWNLPRSLPALLEALLPGRVAYYIGDYWPALNSQYHEYWQAPARSRWTTFPKSLLRRLALRQLARKERYPLCLDLVMVPSAFMRDELQRQGVKLGEVSVVPGAINIRQYVGVDEPPTRLEECFTLLYVGRLTPDKGVMTAIEALARLVHERAVDNLRLLIAGSGPAEYESSLRARAEQLGIAANIEWLGRLSKGDLPALYRSADVFLFTSVWPEPFGRVIVEAMASGLAVVGASVGGAAEILVNHENSLTYTPGNADELAGQIARLMDDEPLRARLAECGRRQAVERWDIQRMILTIEQRLLAL